MAVISMPGTASIPRLAARRRTSSTAAVVSWSVTAMAVTAAADARSTSSRGEHSPSDAVVCRWRSIRIGARRGGARPAGPPSAALALQERTVFPDEELEVLALLVGELQEDLLSL